MSAAAPLPGRALRALAAVAALLAFLPGARADDGRRKQEIQLGELPAHTVGDAPFELKAKATSGLAVAFEVIAGPASMDGRKVKLLGPGLVIVRATQAGDAFYQPAEPAERAFAVAARPAAPSFTVQPMAAAAAVGDPFVLSAAASGEPIPSFQWRRQGVPIAGANERTLAIAAAAPADAGTYDVIATNAVGSATSISVRVSIGRRLQTISFQSLSSVIAGQPVQLAAAASSGLPVQFQVVSGSAVLNGSTLIPQSGLLTIQASQDGNATFEAAAPVTQTLQVSPSPNGQRFP